MTKFFLTSKPCAFTEPGSLLIRGVAIRVIVGVDIQGPRWGRWDALENHRCTILLLRLLTLELLTQHGGRFLRLHGLGAARRRGRDRHDVHRARIRNIRVWSSLSYRSYGGRQKPTVKTHITVYNNVRNCTCSPPSISLELERRPWPPTS